MRDEFTGRTKEVLAKRVGFRCSNPICRRLTAGPQADELRAVNVGVAAHITAAARGGPRYNSRLSARDRAAPRNGIWLCQTCGKLVDNDPTRYTIALLQEWKQGAERIALAELEAPARLPSLEPDALRIATTSVLLPEVHVGTEIHGSNFVRAALDYSVYPFVVEELVSLGVSSFAVVSGTGAALAVPLMPDFLRERIVVIEPRVPHSIVSRLFRAVSAELDVKLEFSQLPVYSVSCSSSAAAKIDNAILSACAELYPILYKLILGMQYGLHIEIDTVDALERLEWLRKRLRSATARGVFSVVSGVLSSYRSVTLDTVRFTSLATSREHARLLARLIEDEDYANLSRAGFDLGMLTRCDTAPADFSMCAAKLVNTPSWRNTLELTSVLVQSASTSVTQAGGSDSLYANSFLPPIVSHERVRRAAEAAWLEARPAPLLPGTQPTEGVIRRSFIPRQDRDLKAKSSS